MIALLLALAASIPVVLGFLGRVHPAFDAFAHFRAHLAVLLAGAALLLLAARQWLHAAAGLALAAGAVVTTIAPLPWQTPAAAAPDAEPEGATYRMLHLNLRFDNEETGEVLSLIGRERPDVVLLNETSAAWRERLSAIAAAYPHRLDCPAPRRVGGVTILSRRPFGAEPGACVLDGRFGVVRIDLGGRTVTFAALHLSWPWPFEQPGEIETVVPVLAALGERTILAGDFNATGWSTAVRRLAAGGGFAQAPRIGPTWLPSALPAALRPHAGLPIDHVMAKDGIVITAIRRMNEVGSDHLPVLVEFRLDQPPAEGAVAVASNRWPGGG